MTNSTLPHIQHLEALPETRRRLLIAIKKAGNICAGKLSKQLGLTREAARQQLILLQDQGLVESKNQSSGGAGRPRRVFSLSKSGEHLFPKRYDELSLILLDSVSDELGSDQLERVLGAVTDHQVAQWQKQLEGLPLRQKLQALKDFYFENDPYTEVIEDEQGLWLLEHNCPFLNLAMERPALCSVTVSTLSRLLGVEVRREKRFQNGDGRCAFHILEGHPIKAGFRFTFEGNIIAKGAPTDS